MTKTVAAFAAVLGLLLTAPVALAHGGAPPREIETRLIADNDGALGFGGCLPEGIGCSPVGLAVDGVDLVVLDVREASLSTGEPVVIFHMVYQTEDEDEGRGVTLTLTAGGAEKTFSFETTGTAPVTKSDFDAVVGPYDAFDGFPKAVDGYLKYSTLGVKVGDELTGIKVASTLDGQESDLMPGTWMTEAGSEAPFIPAGEEIEEPAVGAYKLAGPANLLDVKTETKDNEVTLTIKNPLTAIPQFAAVSLAVPTGIVAKLDSNAVNLDPGATRTVKLTLTPSATAAQVMVNVTSDLGAYSMIMLPVPVAPPPATTTSSATGATTGVHGTHTDSSSTATPHAESESHSESKDGKRDTPGVGFAVVGLAIVALAVIRRRA